MRLLLKFLSAPGSQLLRVRVHLRKEAVHCFGAEEESCRRREAMKAWAQVPLEWRVFLARGRTRYSRERRLVPATRVDVRNRLEQGTLSAPVFAD